MRKTIDPAVKGEVPPELITELRAVAALADDAIDVTSTPEVTDWSGAVRGRFCRPATIRKTLALDSDVLAFYEAQGASYQTQINRTLRASMLRTLRRQRPSG